MKHGGTSGRIAALVLALVVTGLSPLALIRPAAAADVVIVEVPTASRVDPRGISLVGETATQGVVVSREREDTNPSWGTYEPLIVAGDGTTSPAGRVVVDAFGDRLVEAPSGWSDSVITSRLLPDGEWVGRTLPQGYTLVDVTADGILATQYYNGLSLLPWSGGDPVVVSGVPAGYTATYYDTSYTDRHQGSGSIVRMHDKAASGAPHEMYVDTSNLHAWLLPEAGACDARTGKAWGIGTDAIVWRSSTAALLCMVARPTPDQVSIGAAASRPAPTLPVADQLADVALLPVGQDVVMSVRAESGSITADTEMPVLAVHPDGSNDAVLAWGHHVLPSGPTSVLAVGGAQPESTVRRLDLVGGSPEVLIADHPVPATTDGIALDGQHLSLVQDDTASLGGDVVGKRLFNPTTGELGEWTVISDAGNAAGLAADAGSTAWTVNGAWAVSDPAGQVTSQALADGTNLPAGVRALSGPFLMLGGGSTLDTRTNSYSPREDTQDRVLLDGVVYTTGLAAANGPGSSFLARDLETGWGGEIPVPGCVELNSVDGAGKWLLAGCDSGYFLLDRTSDAPPVQVAISGSISLTLGNGFLVRTWLDGSLSWAAASDPNTWMDLAPAGSAIHVTPASGKTAAVAYTDGVTNHVALLPVTPVDVPVPTLTVPRPKAPVVQLEPDGNQLKVSWGDPAVEDQLTGYRISFNGVRAATLAPNARSFTGTISPESRYDVRVTASNIAGQASTMAYHNRLPPPPAPTNVTATVDPVTQEAHVEWDWSPAEGAETAMYFTITAAGHPFVEADGSMRSADFTWHYPEAFTGPIIVTANGPNEDSPGTASAPVTFPGLDTVPPVAHLAAIPPVTLRTALRLGVSGTDDRAISHFQIRVRSGTPAGPLGYWKTLPLGQLDYTDMLPGSTYCFSVRAVDRYSNTSAWTPAQCTTVAIDERLLTKVRGTWQRVFGRRYYQGAAYAATSGTPILAIANQRTNGVWLIASTCPTCGKVTVRDSSGYARTVSLRSRTRHDRVAVRVPWTAATTGTITVRRAVGPGLVLIDGLAVRAY